MLGMLLPDKVGTAFRVLASNVVRMKTCRGEREAKKEAILFIRVLLLFN